MNSLYTGFHTSNKKYEYTQIIAFEKRYSGKEVAYTIICTAMDSDIEKYKKTFNRIISSFKIQ